MTRASATHTGTNGTAPTTGFLDADDPGQVVGFVHAIHIPDTNEKS